MRFSPALPAPSAHVIDTCIAVPLLAFALLLSCFGIGRSPATFSRGTFFRSFRIDAHAHLEDETEGIDDFQVAARAHRLDLL